MTSDLFAKAARFIYLSRARTRVQGRGRQIYRNAIEEHAELVQLYFAEPEFQEAVHCLLESSEMKLMDATQSGLHLAASGADSMWATTVSDYKLRIKKQNVPTSRVLIVHMALALCAFPASEDLEALPSDLGVITRSDIMQQLERFARAAASLPQEEDDLLSPDERSCLLDFTNLPQIRPNVENSADSWVGLVNRVIAYMVETAYLSPHQNDSDEGEVEYWVTRSYQSAFKGAAATLFARFRALESSHEQRSNMDMGEL